MHWKIENQEGTSLNLQYQDLAAAPWGCSPSQGGGKDQRGFLAEPGLS